MARNKKNAPAKASPSLERETYICSDSDCREFGIITYLPGKCRRCKFDKSPRDEWEELYGYLFQQQSSDDGPTLGHALPSLPILSGSVTNSAVVNDTWDAPACLSSCPIAPQAEIYIPDHLFKTWIDLAREFNTEWIAYLQGYALLDKPFSYQITDMTFPKQKANGAHVEILEGERAPQGTVAAVHSHVGMEVFFSNEDQKHFNWPVELVVNRRGEIKANGLTKLECGRQHRGEAKIWLTGREPFRALANQLKGVLEEDTTRLAVNGSCAPVVHAVKG